MRSSSWLLIVSQQMIYKLLIKWAVVDVGLTTVTLGDRVACVSQPVKTSGTALHTVDSAPSWVPCASCAHDCEVSVRYRATLHTDGMRTASLTVTTTSCHCMPHSRLHLTDCMFAQMIPETFSKYHSCKITRSGHELFCKCLKTIFVQQNFK